MSRRTARLTARLAALVAAGLVLLSGCGLPSEEPEAHDLPEAVLADDLTLYRELITEDGAKLAVYSAALPQLQEQEGTGAAAINQFYRSEMEVLRADCDTWFNVVSEKNYPDTRTNSFAYRLLDAPAGFLAVERVMEVDGTANHYFTELFSLVSGWQRSFSDLYNTTVKCESTIRGAVRDWCVRNQIPCDELDTLSLSQLTAAFLPDGDSLRLYIDHRTLSVQQVQAVIVEIPLRDLEDFRLN